MDLWSQLPSGVGDDGGLDGLEPLLSNVEDAEAVEETDGDGTWRVWRLKVAGDEPLSIDPATGDFTRAQPSTDAPLEFPDPRVQAELRLHLHTPDGDPDGWVRLIVSTPAAVLRVPELRAASLDDQGQLRPVPGNQLVRFLLPALRVQFERTATGPVDVELLSAATGTPQDQIHDFIRMEPPYALIGPGEVVGFAFRAAVLDLSGTAGPSGVPAGARTMPDTWQGLWLPEVRLFVSPSGMEGLAVSAGVRDLWIGIGVHEGVTGVFETEVVNRGQHPDVRLRFLTATGRWIGVPDTDPTTPVEVPSGSRVHVDAGGGLAPFATRITVDGTVTDGTIASVDPPANGSITVQVQVTDAAGHVTTRIVPVARATTAPSGTRPDGVAVTATTTSATTSRVVVLGQSTTTVTLGVTPAGGTLSWTLPDGGTAPSETVKVPVAAGTPVDVSVTRTTQPTPAATAAVDCYFRFDHPRPRAGDQLEAHLDSFAANPDNTFVAPTAARRSDDGAPPLLTGPGGSWPGAAAYPAGTTWDVDGFASYEALGDPTIDGVTRKQYDRELSERRRDVLVRILRDAGFTATAGAANGHTDARASSDPEDPRWWRATATPSLSSDATETVTARIERPAPVLDEPDPEPSRDPVPACFRKIGARVELVRSTFVRAEVYGEFDVRTGAEQAVASTGAGALPARTNPGDGLCAFLVRLRIAEDRSSWDVTAEFRALDADLDGLARIRRGASGDHTAIDVLGALTALSPLLAAATPPSPTAGELVPMAIVGGTALALGASGAWTTREVTLWGGQLVVSDGLVDPTSGDGPRRTQVSVLLDVETAFTFDLVILRVREDAPLRARYKAVGLRAGWDTVDDGGDELEYVPLPVFDPSQGYTLDIPAGSMVAPGPPGPLGELLRVLGGRISRDNPTFLEIEVGIGVDLGIIGVESARVRVQLDGDGAGDVELTKLAATLDIPGTLHGKGFISITESGFSGGLDLTIVPIEIRAAATISLRRQDGVTSVLAGLEVEFPVPIVLGSSGLGIFGLLAGVGVNVERIPGTGPNPALDWVRSQLTPPRVGIVDEAGWRPEAGGYAFAAGMLLGTMEGGFLVHMKGAVLIEVPGPRLLLIMKADVLKLPPLLDDHRQQATFLAVLEIDFARGEITLGLVAEYTIQQLLQVRVPVTAFFSTQEPSRFFVDLGRFDDPVTVRILDVFEGTGYLMIHGDGISGHPVPALNTGSTNLTIAVGFHLRAVLMGSKSVGLYLEAAGGFDALLAFDPLFVGGDLYVSGELRLFIVSIGASARLEVVVTQDKTYVKGAVCGKVSFFFFSVEGCVSFELNAPPPFATPAPDLVAGVVLVGRTPALVEGSAVGRSVDAKLADAIDVTGGGGGDLPTVPLDAIPVVLFDAPLLDDDAVVLGGTPHAHPGGGGNPWVRRGDRWWRYELVEVRLDGPLLGTKTPSTWWRPADTDDPAYGPALALLSWLPTPTPHARPYSDSLVESVHRRYETVCEVVAPPAPLLWTFVDEPSGSSAPGWVLRGTPWPDPPGATRSAPAERRLDVEERWRVPDPIADARSGIVAAAVVGDAVACRKDPPEVVTDLQDWTTALPPGPSYEAGLPALADVAALGTALQASGGSLHDVAATLATTTWDPGMLPPRVAADCRGAVLRSPRFDRGIPAPDAPPEVAARVRELWAEAGHEPTQLADVVRLSARGGLLGCTVLLLADEEEVAADRLVLRVLDDTGGVLDERVVRSADRVHGGNPLPTRWTDPTGPWAADIDAAGQVAARIAARREHRRESLYLVGLEGPAPGIAVDIGWRRIDDGLEPHRRFHVVAIEGQLGAEVARSDRETLQRDRDRDAFEAALTQDSSDHALLQQGQRYEVVVRWRAESREEDEQPAATSGPIAGDVVEERFAFRADGADEMPDDLRPWLLATAPGEDEVGYLTDEPIRVALATSNVARLFEAYDRELRLRVRAASGDHPQPDLTIPVALIAPVEEAPDTLQVSSAWGRAAAEVAADLACIPDVATSEHRLVVFEVEFEPRTDYLLDVVAVPEGAPLDTPGEVLHRVGFSTGLYATVDEIARLVRSGTVEHVGVASVAALAALPDRPTGQQVDEAFQAAGLSVPQVPRHPRMQILWTWADPPQPVAVVVESNEPLWRTRTMPRVVTGPTDATNPGHEWWAAVEVDWLSLAPPTGSPLPNELPAAPVSQIVRGPGDTRAIVLLGAGARGSAVRLELVNDGDDLAGAATTRHLAVDVPLLAAPWEEA